MLAAATFLLAAIRYASDARYADAMALARYCAFSCSMLFMAFFATLILRYAIHATIFVIFFTPKMPYAFCAFVSPLF